MCADTCGMLPVDVGYDAAHVPELLAHGQQSS